MFHMPMFSALRQSARPLILLAAGLMLAACEPADGPTPADAPKGPEQAAEAPASPSVAGQEEAAAPAAEDDGPLVIYSGRKESLIGPLIERFQEQSGIAVEMRWGDTAPLAATLLEEGEASRADVFFAQDPGGLGAVETLLAPLPESLLTLAPSAFRDPAGRWVGVSGRSRVLVYNRDTVKPADLPADLEDLTLPAWKGRVGWAPTNASFQAMVTAMRKLQGEDETRRWLEGMLANEPVAYESNAPVVAAVGAGEVEIGLVNHYYLHRFLVEEGPDFPARNHFMQGGGPGSLVLVSGAGVLARSTRKAQAEAFIAFLLSEASQRFLADESWEYPVVASVPGPEDLPSLAELKSPALPLADLADMEGTLTLLRETGVLP